MAWAHGYRPTRALGGRRRNARRCAFVVALATGSISNALLAVPDHPVKAPIPTHDLLFQAGNVTIEGPLSTLTLCDSVEVAVHRYRLSADKLTLRRTPGGLLVEGPGLVSFCPCKATPVTVAFTEATVAPPTDLLIKNAVVRVSGVPVFYTPVLWLRSPNRIGLLSPHFGWRARDGFWAGSGLHLPLRNSDQSDPVVMDINAGGYARGGWDLGGQLTTSGSTTRIRWDHIESSFVEVDAHGSRQLGQSSIDWSADLLRGPRARVGFVSPEAASRQNDRARAEIIHSDGKILAGVGLRFDAWRAAAIDSVSLLGPQLRLAAGTSLDKVGHFESTTSLVGWSANSQYSSMLMAHGDDISVDARPAIFVGRASLHERFAVTDTQEQKLRAALAGGEVRVSLPLVKNWDMARDYWSHWFEPFALATAATDLNNLEGPSARSMRTGTLQVGLLNILGRPLRDTAYQVELRGGLVSTVGSQSTAAAIRSRASGKWIGAGSDIVWAERNTWMSSSRLRLGDVQSADMTIRVEGRTKADWVPARWLTDEAWVAALSPWLVRGGWTSIAETAVSPTDWLAVNGGIGGDLSAQALLFDYASIAFRHPCGCLAISTIVSERLGRSGWDAWGMLDLMPQ